MFRRPKELAELVRHMLASILVSVLGNGAVIAATLPDIARNSATALSSATPTLAQVVLTGDDDDDDDDDGDDDVGDDDDDDDEDD